MEFTCTSSHRFPAGSGEPPWSPISLFGLLLLFVLQKLFNEPSVAYQELLLSIQVQILMCSWEEGSSVFTYATDILYPLTILYFGMKSIEGLLCSQIIINTSLHQIQFVPSLNSNLGLSVPGVLLPELPLQMAKKLHASYSSEKEVLRQPQPVCRKGGTQTMNTKQCKEYKYLVFKKAR